MCWWRHLMSMDRVVPLPCPRSESSWGGPAVFWVGGEGCESGEYHGGMEMISSPEQDPPGWVQQYIPNTCWMRSSSLTMSSSKQQCLQSTVGVHADLILMRLHGMGVLWVRKQLQSSTYGISMGLQRNRLTNLLLMLFQVLLILKCFFLRCL